MVLDKQFLDKKVPRLRGYKPIPSVLNKEEVTEFISSVNNDMSKVILNTMYSSGLRIGEVVKIHELRNYVKVYKKRYGYKFNMDDFLFPSPYFKGEHISKKLLKQYN